MSEQRPVPNLMKALRESLEKAVQPPATPQEEQAQTLNDVFDVFETWARRKGATDNSSVSLGFWAFNEFHAIIGQPLRDWMLSRRASAPPAVWQDIETAPKDGRYVWLYSPHFRKYFTAAGNILPGRWDATVGRWSVPHWGHIDVAPTHFQPLPSPPTPGETR